MRLIDADALINDVDGDLLDGIAEARAIEKIENAPTIGGWISVKDRLPESGKRCLVYAAQGIERHISIASFGRHFHLSGRRAYWRVTHWMPFPEPPEEGKRE
jgi:hypothetical protein